MLKKTLMIPNNVSGEEKQLSAQKIRASHYIKVIISLLTCYYTITRTFCYWYRGLHNVFHSYLLWRNIVHHPLLVFVMRFEVPYFILIFVCPNFDFFLILINLTDTLSTSYLHNSRKKINNNQGFYFRSCLSIHYGHVGLLF